MSNRPADDAAHVRPLIPVAIGAVIGIVWVLVAVAGMGPFEIVLILLPFLVFGLPALAFYLWAKRRGDID